MKYKTLEDNVGKIGIPAGSIVEYDQKVADHLIKLGVIKPVKEAKEEATKEEKKPAPKKVAKKKESK